MHYGPIPDVIIDIDEGREGISLVRTTHNGRPAWVELNDPILDGQIVTRDKHGSLIAKRNAETQSKEFSSAVSEVSVKGSNDHAFEAAMLAFQKGPPGILRLVKHIDSYPGEHRGDRDAYLPMSTTGNDERQAIADAINAYLKAKV